jgi:OFA family oxalate/formate antiporter-like MFS transporter
LVAVGTNKLNVDDDRYGDGMQDREDTSSQYAFSRWLPVVGGLLLTMALGTFYATSIFILPLEKEFDWTRSQTSWITTFGAVMVACWFVVGGWLQDQKGPRIVAGIGGLLFSGAFLWGSQIHSLSAFYLSIGVCLGIGVGFGYVVPMAVGAKWFPDKRGLIVGLMVAGSGLGSGIFGPLASRLIGRVGWRTTMQILSAIFFVMTAVATVLLKAPPEGYRPRGWSPTQVEKNSARSMSVSTRRMIRTPTFWLYWMAYCLGATSGLMVISQLVPFARSAGNSTAVAAFAITVGALGNTMGRVFSGWISDYAGRVNTVRIALLFSAIAMPLLFRFRHEIVLFYILLGVVYYCYGTQFSVYPSLSADSYGTKHMGLNYGLLLMAWGVAGILGPFLGGHAYVETGDYQAAFYISAALSLVALAILFAPKAQPNGKITEEPELD